jgi:hypothetical protein
MDWALKGVARARMKMFAAVLFLVVFPTALTGQLQKPPSANTKPSANIDRGLHELVEMRQERLAKNLAEMDVRTAEQSARVAKAATGVFHLIVDRSNRVLVNVHLDGSVSVAELSRVLVSTGASIVAADTGYRNGVLAAYVPVESVMKLANTPGIHSITLAHRPHSNAGKVTSQGAALLQTDLSNAAGFDGTGVTVGILSDSFNTSSGFGVTDNALSDVASGDLPDTTAIPGGEGLKFLIELDPNTFGPGTDEGRALAQIVHDLAPGASLCFATGFVSEVDFANNIRMLRTNPGCRADVIVDDIEYDDEPFFSDGILAQAVDDVAASDSLPGRKVSYFSSAGNDAHQGYSSDLRIIADSAARAMTQTATRVALNTIPSDIDTSGGFHNFDPNGGTLLAQDFVFFDGASISFQWDDPFDLSPSGITTDLNLLFFDPTNGNFLFAVNDDNFQTNQPIELFSLVSRQGPGTVDELLMAVARTGAGSHLARRIKYVAFGGIFDLSGVVTAETPLTFGHNSALGANGVGAVVYNTDPAFFGPPKFSPLYENFSSPGPTTIAFDKDGRRLTRAEVRLKPDIAAPDGVNTTFFPEFGSNLDYEARFGVPDKFPNFFGNSASAAHAAGVAALMVQKSGGPGAISPTTISKALKASAPARDVDLGFSKVTAATDGENVTVSANGNNLNIIFLNTSFFQINFTSTIPGQTLDRLTIDVSQAGMAFDQDSFPLQVGSSTGPTITSSTPKGISRKLTINFSGFTSGKSLTFGVGLNFTDAHGNPITFQSSTADEVAGASVTATLSHVGNNVPPKVTGTFTNELGKGYRIFDGFGLINAPNALNALRPHNE